MDVAEQAMALNRPRTLNLDQDCTDDAPDAPRHAAG